MDRLGPAPGLFMVPASDIIPSFLFPQIPVMIG
jgi:hypothetical protein